MTIEKTNLERLQRVFDARKKIRATGTDALRIVDRSGDGFENLEIDDFAGNWLVQTRGKGFPEWLRGFSPQPNSIFFKRLGEEKNAPEWIAGEKLDAPFLVHENGAKFWIDFQSGYSQGIFLDQRDNRARLRHTVAALCERRHLSAVSLRRSQTAATAPNVLNCFGYTCAFGVCAALGGARTVNVDLSRNYLDWGRRNYEINGLDVSATGADAAHDFIFGDVFNWLDRFRKKGRRFDVIVLDPPTFARDDKGRVFTVEGDFSRLVSEAAQTLAPGGTLLCSTNQRSLTVAAFRQIVMRGWKNPPPWKIGSAPMPSDFTGEQYLKSLWGTERV